MSACDCPECRECHDCRACRLPLSTRAYQPHSGDSACRQRRRGGACSQLNGSLGFSCMLNTRSCTTSTGLPCAAGYNAAHAPHAIVQRRAARHVQWCGAVRHPTCMRHGNRNQHAHAHAHWPAHWHRRQSGKSMQRVTCLQHLSEERANGRHILRRNIARWLQEACNVARATRPATVVAP